MAKVSLLVFENEIADYGISNLFTNYIVEQYGEGIISDIYKSGIDPVKAIAGSNNVEFENIYMNWIIANRLHSLKLAPEYSYKLALEGDPAHSLLATNYTGFNNEFRPNAVKYYEIQGSLSKMKFSGAQIFKAISNVSEIPTASIITSAPSFCVIFMISLVISCSLGFNT